MQIQLHFPSEENQYYFQQDSHDGSPCTSLGFSQLQSHSIFRPNSVQCTAQETSLHINSIYKGLQHTLQSMWFRDQKQGINKLVKYEDGTLSTKVISIFKTVKRHQCWIWWGQTLCQAWKNSRSGKTANGILNNIQWVPQGRDWLCTLSCYNDSGFYLTNTPW